MRGLHETHRDLRGVAAGRVRGPDPDRSAHQRDRGWVLRRGGESVGRGATRVRVRGADGRREPGGIVADHAAGAGGDAVWDGGGARAAGCGRVSWIYGAHKGWGPDPLSLPPLLLVAHPVLQPVDLLCEPRHEFLQARVRRWRWPRRRLPLLPHAVTGSSVSSVERGAGGGVWAVVRGGLLN